jgi:flagellar hook-length control protein FliK
MASVPNTRTALSPAPAGQASPAAVDPAGFARQLAEIPEELLRIAASALSGGSGDAPAADGTAQDCGDATQSESAETSSDAAQLAALVPVLQSLPAIVAAPVAAPASPPAPAAVAAPSAPTAAPARVPAPAPAPAPALEAQPKAEPGAANTPPLVVTPSAAAPAPAGKIRPVKPEAQAGEAGSDPHSEPSANGPETPPAFDPAAKESVAAAKRAIDAALRFAMPAIAQAAPKIAQPAARLIASALQAVREARPTSPIADTAASISDIAAPAVIAIPPAPAPAAPLQPREADAAAPDRALDLANDAEWLDRLARDIAQAAGNEGTIRFRLHPQTLGHLRVELSQGDHGTSIRLTADTEQARAILADAQPRLVAEARAQGVRIAETHVDLTGSDRNASGDQRRQDDSRQTPLIRTARGAAAGADAPVRPGRSRSDRYA